MGALDELLGRWRENPDTGTTLALCTYLGTSKREDLIREVGSTAEAWHKDDPQVMLAVGRMYLDAGLLAEAQAILVTAGKLVPDNASAYRYLGEVLLRRGDAARAEKVLARALQIGSTESDTRMWHDRAVVYLPLQTRVGQQAVADDVERTIPRRISIPPPALRPSEADDLVSTARATFSHRAGAGRPPPPKLGRSVPPPPPPPPPRPAGQEVYREQGRAKTYSESDIDTGVFDAHLLSTHGGRSEGSTTDVMAAAQLPSSQRSAPPPPPSKPPAARSVPPPPPHPPPRAAPLPVPKPPPRSTPPPPRTGGTAQWPAQAPPTSKLAFVSAGSFDDSPNPSPKTVLEHLLRVGIYDRGGGAPPAWVAPPRERPRGSWVFIVAMVLAAGGGFGGFKYARQIKEQKLATARGIELRVSKSLETGNIEDLRKTDAELSKAFDLDSRSEQAAILWLKNRVLSALMLAEEAHGIESALSRAKTLGIEDSKVAFGKIASFLAEGDLAGAAAVLSKWDEKAKADPFYHLVAAAMLERAGDVRAIGRYKQAFELDPDLAVARIFHAELVTLELGIEQGKPIIEEAKQKLGETPISRALTGLAWAADPASGDTPPDTARIIEADRGKLPAQLLAIPYVVDARAAARAGHTEEALAILDKGLKVSATPAMAYWIGQTAIDLGDEKLARAATLRALSYSALYPRARSLAARVALLGGRLEEAKKAIQELDSKSVEAAVVRAAAAYEATDAAELETATEALGSKEGAAKALSAGVGVMTARKYPLLTELEKMAVPSVPWGDLVAVDAALDQGDVRTADKIVARWGERASTASYALRRARLLRYQGKIDDAVAASDDALVPGSVTARVLIERFHCLIAAKKISGVRELLGQYPAVLGPLTEFLKVTTDVADDKAARAKATAARIDPPPDGSPLLIDLIATEALVGVGDRRGKPMATALIRRNPRNPDVLAVARAVGLAR
jgi:tetratricopeptide (TPR) repeat protein